MFYLPLAVVTWFSVGWMIDRNRRQELLVYGLFGAALATIQDRLVLLYQLWEYRDVGLVATHAEIAFLISLSAAPVFAMRFVQGLRPGGRLPWLRVARYTAIAMLPEAVGLQTGNLVYHQWWNAGWSVMAYLPIWGGLWLLHRWLHRTAAAGVGMEE